MRVLKIALIILASVFALLLALGFAVGPTPRFSAAGMETFRESADSSMCFGAVEDYILGGMRAYDGRGGHYRDAEIEGDTIVAWTPTIDNPGGQRIWKCRWDPSVVVMNGLGTRALDPSIGHGNLIEIEQIFPDARLWDCRGESRDKVCVDAGPTELDPTISVDDATYFPSAAPPDAEEVGELRRKARTCVSLMLPLWNEIVRMSQDPDFQLQFKASDRYKAWEERVQAAEGIDAPPHLSDLDRELGRSCGQDFKSIGAPIYSAWPITQLPVIAGAFHPRFSFGDDEVSTGTGSGPLIGFQKGPPIGRGARPGPAQRCGWRRRAGSRSCEALRSGSVFEAPALVAGLDGEPLIRHWSEDNGERSGG